MDCCTAAKVSARIGGMCRPTFAIRAALFFLLSLAMAGAGALERVNLQFKWTHAFQFAGYYAALEKGYYAEAGLDVVLHEAHPGEDPMRQVIDGKAEYGVGNSSLLLARQAGAPVVALAVIFQHSPLVLLARQTRAAQDVHDLVGKRLMIEPHSDELLAYLKQEGVPLERIEQLPHSFNPADLIAGKVDAISAYVTNETFYLDQADLPYQVYTPRSAGIDFYGDNLFTTERELRDHPARAAAFRAASLRGWQYAMAHPGEITDLILSRYSQEHERAFLLNEARRMEPLLRTDLIEIGYMNPGRWRHIADTYADLGLLPRSFSLDGFLYQVTTERDQTAIYIATGLLAIISLVAFYIFSINRRLRSVLVDAEKTHAALSLSEERHRLLADNATDVIWTMDLEGRFTYVSPSALKLRGVSALEMIGQNFSQVMTPASAEIGRALLGQVLQAIRGGQAVPEFRGELELTCKHGGTVWTETTTTGMLGADGRFTGILGVSRDIHERREAEERMRHLAQFDVLTDLPNRILFSDRLERALARLRREGLCLAVLFVDLDHFKPINDNHGHAVGDRVLREAAKRMLAAVRESDTVARIGGDEFFILLPEVADTDGAVQVAEKVRQALLMPFMIDDLELCLSCSIGIALAPQHGDKEIILAKRADSAMYRAKNDGRDSIRVFDPASTLFE
jgi:diguanylate cyclase (GGDEF)-like protein/PAS domain S-box-containing protein